MGFIDEICLKWNEEIMCLYIMLVKSKICMILIGEIQDII